MRLIQDYQDQLQTILHSQGNEFIKTEYGVIIEVNFSYLYALNLIARRIELERFFNTQYFSIAYSCLIESYSLALDNHSRGSALVLRSALENFLKSAISVAGNGSYIINDRSYSANKKTLELIIDDVYPEKYKVIFKRTTDQMNRIYGILSGLSHSLTPESQNNMLSFFSDVKTVSRDRLNFVFNNMKLVFEYIFTSSLLVARSSLELWERSTLKDILSLVYGTKRTAKTLLLFVP
ncbi:hypothetical protein [Paenibacillus amylolyticus]|uniref:Uncharacterized protein n=1 Tax=Paenibacillus amylolyticus TaxID=1451 RepID=A0A100VM90_PAEAM|nr:hypothetical protein [Paenibacillus amylolyticus]GAS82374.1 unknown protein [Paenibacillus amylolyticus]